MKGKGVFLVGFISVIVFIIISAYFWYLYFLDLHNDGKLNNNSNQLGKLVMVDISGVNATNEESKEDGSDTPSYVFRIDNRKTGSTNYNLYIEDTPYNLVSDGCSSETTLKRSDLSYQLKLNGYIVKRGLMTDIEDNILDTRHINIDVSNQYELTIWINENAIDWEGKHYHYKVTLKEVE